MNPSPENTSTAKLSTEELIGNSIDRFGHSIEQIGDSTIRYLEYQTRRDACHLLADKTKIGLLFSLMVSSWLTVALLIFIAAMIFLGAFLGPLPPTPEMQPVAPPSAERPDETHHPLEARIGT